MTHYTMTKYADVIQAPAGMPSPGPYYTTLVPMADVVDFPYDYALYFSTDHHNAEGGIWAYFCNGLPSEANWISYDDALAAGAFDHVEEKPAANPIYHDNTQGNGHTETPYANVIDGTVYLSYHKNGIAKSQATLLATSQDGIHFTRINGDDNSVILAYDVERSVGDGHTGYFRWALNPFSGVDEKYIGYSLHGGGDQYYSALWGSDDAINWKRLEVLIPIEGQALDDETMMIVWHELDPSSIRQLDSGEYVAICGVGNRASGAAARIVELYQVYLAADGRTLTRPSVKLLGVGEQGASDSEELASPTCQCIDGQIHLLYVGAGNGGQKNTVMSARGTFDASAALGPALSAADQSRHLLR